jgi:thiamine kinase
VVLAGHRRGIDSYLLVKRSATNISPVRCLRSSDSARYRSLDSFLSQFAKPFEYDMSASLDPLEVMDRIPGMHAKDFRIEVLSGGLTNRVFKLSNNGDAYVLRLDADHTAQLGLDRATEHSILERAYAKGLAPEMVHMDESGGILLLRYIDGRVWTAADLLDSENIELLADLLRRVHALPLCGKKFDAGAIADTYLKCLENDADTRKLSQHCRDIIRSVDAIASQSCCHNDVVAGNIISTPNLMLLDWEYASDNDPLFDLASLIAFHELDDISSMTLLSAYAGGSTPELRERLALQVRQYNALYGLWLASRQVSTPDTVQARKLQELKTRLA